MWKRFLPIASVLVAVLLATTSWLAERWVTLQAQDDIGKALQTVLDTSHQAVRTWATEQKSAATIWADDPEIRRWAEALLDTSREPTELLEAPAQTALRARLAPLIAVRRYHGFFIIGPNAINLASTRDSNLGTPSLLLEQPRFLEEVWAGDASLSLPLTSNVALPDPEGAPREKQATMFVGAPILDDHSEAIAILALRINPAEDFTAILQRGRVGDTGETYSFDAEGRLISQSRFDQQLREIGLIAEDDLGILNILIRDPGANLVAGEESGIPLEDRPLTRMAASALSAGSGIDLKGYRDYRGIPVVGAWLWDADLGIGLTTEIDVSEAYAPLRSTRLIIAASTAFSIALVFALATLFGWSRRHVLASEVRFRGLFENAPDASLIVGESGEILLANDRVKDVFGFTPAELSGVNIEALVPARFSQHPEFVARYFDAPCIRTMGVATEIYGRKNDGSEFPAEISLSPLRTKEPLSVAVAVRDVSEQKRARDEHWVAEHRTRLLKEMAMAANTAESSEDALQAALDQICAYTNWQVGHAYLRAADAMELEPSDLWHLDEPERFRVFRELTSRTRFAAGIGLPGRVLRSGRPAWITDVTLDPNFPRAKLAEDLGVRGAFAFPVCVEGEVSRPGGLHPRALSEPDVNVSAHPAPIIQPPVPGPSANARTVRDRVQPRDLASASHGVGASEVS